MALLKPTHSVQVARAAVHTATTTLVRPTGRPFWVAGVRVLLALYAPLLLGIAVNRPAMFVPVGIGALVGSLVDPGCASTRRAWTIGVTSVLAAVAFALGDLLGHTPLTAIPFAVLVVFVCGLAPEFGAAGIRGSLYVGTCTLLGIASSGVDPGFITAPGLLAGGAWALLLAVGPFRQAGSPRRSFIRRARSLTSNLKVHLRLDSAIARHAARLAVAVGIALALSFLLQRPMVTWIAGSALAVLHPRVTAHATRSIRLLVGTLVGGLGAVALAEALGPGTLLLVALAPAIFLAVSVRSVDYVAYTVTSTAFFLALSAFTTHMSWSLLDARLIDTAIGVVLALLISLLSLPQRERERLAEEIEAR
jgi:uncharacterized membrane protein YccC